MFNFNKKPQRISEPKEGCKIKIKYDKHGRVSGYESNGNCGKSDLEAFENKMFNKQESNLEED